MFLENKNINSEDHKILAVFNLSFFLVDESVDRLYSSCAFYSRFTSTSKMPATSMRIWGDDG